MDIKENKKIIGLLIIYFILVLFTIKKTITLGVTVNFSICLIVFFSIVLFCFMDLTKRAGLLMFLATFFIFLLGGEMATLFFQMPQEYKATFNLAINKHVYNSLLISLIFLFLGFITFSIFSKRKKDSNRFLEEETLAIRKISKIGIIISVVPVFIKEIEAGIFVFKKGYLSYYTSYESSLPFIVITLAEMFPLFIYIYLATMPKKKKCLGPILLYLMSGILGLLTGRRLMFGAYFLFILFYILLRHKKNKEENWINKKKMLILIISCFFLIIYFYAHKYIRYGDKPKEKTIPEMFVGFFSQQGVSINTLKFQKLFEGDNLGCTSFYWTKKYLRTGLITRKFISFPTHLYDTRSIMTAFDTNNLADYLQYKIDPKAYFEGYGYGTSYIAEAYHDMGYIGIMIVNFIYGILLSFFYNFEKKNISLWRVVFGFMIFEKIILAPRYSVDIFLTPFMNLANMTVLIFIILVYKNYDRLNIKLNKFQGGK